MAAASGMSDDAVSRQSGLRSVPRLILDAIRLVRRAAPRQHTYSVVLQIATAVLIGAQLLVGRQLVSELIKVRSRDGADVGHLVLVFGALIVTTLVVGGVAAMSSLQQRLLSEHVGRHTFDGIIEVATSVSFANYEDPVFFDRLQRARDASLHRPVTIVNNVTSLGTAVITSIGMTAALLSLQPILVPLVFLAGVPLLVAALRNSRRSYAFEYALTRHGRERLHLMELLTSQEAAKELRVFDSTPWLRRLYDEYTDERITLMTRSLRERLGISLIGVLANAVGTAIALGALVWLLASNRTDVATAAAAAVAMLVLASRLSALTSSLGAIVEAGMFLDDYASFVALRPAVPVEGQATAPVAPVRPFSGLRVENLSFTYPNTDRQVLQDVSIEVEPGEVIALVGENGSGKTTLVKLLCQLYREPEAGRILWGGTDAQAIQPQEIQRQITVLFQDFVQYQLTVADNIGLGRATQAFDEDLIRDSARQAGADRFIERFEAGYGARLGRQFLGGVELSGGQWQRLALARAFYRGGDFLIMDEPTAALDPRAEYELFQQMRALAAGKSVLLISHRFSSVRMADRIYVLKDGQVAESGAHADLMALSGIYAELFNLQASAYLGERPVALP